MSEFTRIEVIDHRKDAPVPGRCFVHWDALSRIDVSEQDQGRTLKIFIMDAPDKMPTEES